MSSQDAAPTNVLPKILTQHAEEAAFLWLLRDQAVSARQFLVKDLARLDDRVEAQLDGLEVVSEALEPGDPGAVLALAVLAFEQGDEARIQDVLTGGTAARDLERGIVSALGWIGYERARAHLKPLLAAESTVLRRVGLAAAAIHRKNPGPAVLEAAFASDDPRLKARALRAVGELGLVDYHIPARSNLRAKD